MRPKSNKSALYYGSFVFMGLAICLLGYLTVCYFNNCKTNNTDFSDGIGQILQNNPGDFLWGTGGILLTFASSLLLILTFNEQRKQFEEQYRTEYASRFENTFFNLMTMFYNVRQSVNNCLSERMVNVKKSEGSNNDENLNIRNIEDYAKKFISETKGDEKIIQQSKDLAKNDITKTEKDNIRYNLGECLRVYNSKFGFPLSYYYRYLYNLINYVIDYWGENTEEVIKYLKFIQAQMSDAELALLFYNCLSKDSKDSNHNYSFFKKINKYNFLENINEEWLIDRNNHFIYDMTCFRFLNRDELAKKLKS